MSTTTLGPFNLPSIGLGCMNMSSGYGPAEDQSSERLLPAALDAGYRLFDTAAMYGDGHNESLIGRVLKERRQELVLASKGGLSKGPDGQPLINGRPEVLKRECEQSLRRLQTEVIDLYYLHRLDPDVPVEESVGAMAELIAEGKVQALGLSEVCSETLRRAYREHPISAVQSEYSLWSRTPERAMLQSCDELGVTFVAFSPLGRGFLTGKAADVSELTEADIRQSIARPRFEAEAFARNSTLLVPMAEIANRYDCTLAQLALAWLLAKTERRVIAIPGTKHLGYMQENIQAAELQLNACDVERLDGLINEQTVVGSRYTEALMASTDAERD